MYSVRLESETCEEIERLEEPIGFLDRLPEMDPEGRLILLRFLDPYGDTIFNGLQASQLLTELEAIRDKLDGESDLVLLGRVEALARRCQRESHCYLRFMGD